MTDAVYGILPVKALGFAKRRLRDHLSLQERKRLMVELYVTGLRALQEAVPARQVIVVSHDLRVLALAQERGAQPLAQLGYGLNGAVEEGRAWALAAGAEAILVVLADLPLVAGEALRQLLALSRGGREVILAPGQRGGAHALFCRPASLLKFVFGRDSRRRFMAQAAQVEARLTLFDSPALSLDIDTADDWRCLLYTSDAC